MNARNATSASTPIQPTDKSSLFRRAHQLARASSSPADYRDRFSEALKAAWVEFTMNTVAASFALDFGPNRPTATAKPARRRMSREERQVRDLMQRQRDLNAGQRRRRDFGISPDAIGPWPSKLAERREHAKKLLSGPLAPLAASWGACAPA